MKQHAKPSPPPASFRIPPWIPVILLILAGAAVYAHTLDVPFYFDDTDNIRDNPHIRLTSLSPQGLSDAAFKSLSSVRPLPNISFALNYYFHGYTVTGYHFVNITIHILTGILLFFLFSATLSSPALRGRFPRPALIAAAAALLWLVHPLHTQSVTYIVQRMNSMAALFSILCLTLYSCARLSSGARARLVLFAGSAAAWIAALGSKQIAAAVPAGILLYEWYFFQSLSWEWLKSHKRYAAGVVVLSFLAAALFLAFNPKGDVFSLYAFRDFTLSERVLTQLRVVMFYLSLIVYPHPGRLSLEHDFSLSHSLIDPPITVFALAAVAGIFGFALWRSRKEPLLSFALLWFFGNLAIESSIIPLELVFEHRTYLPSVFLALAAAALVYRIIRQPWVASAALALIILMLASWTWERNRMWKNPVAFWTDCVAKAPLKPRPHTSLGVALYRQGKDSEAAKQFTEAIRLDPRQYLALSHLGMIAARQGKRDQAVSYFRQAVDIAPADALGQYNLGRGLLDQGKSDEALEHLAKAVELDPELSVAHCALGQALAERGGYDQALSHFTRALQLQPDFADAHLGMGIVYGRKKNYNKAIPHFSEVLRLDPRRPGAHYNLGLIYRELGDTDKAREQFQETLRLKPGHAQAKQQLDEIEKNVRK